MSEGQTHMQIAFDRACVQSTSGAKRAQGGCCVWLHLYLSPGWGNCGSSKRGGPKIASANAHRSPPPSKRSPSSPIQVVAEKKRRPSNTAGPLCC